MMYRTPPRQRRPAQRSSPQERSPTTYCHTPTPTSQEPDPELLATLHLSTRPSATMHLSPQLQRIRDTFSGRVTIAPPGPNHGDCLPYAVAWLLRVSSPALSDITDTAAIRAETALLASDVI